MMGLCINGSYFLCWLPLPIFFYGIDSPIYLINSKELSFLCIIPTISFYTTTAGFPSLVNLDGVSISALTNGFSTLVSSKAGVSNKGALPLIDSLSASLTWVRAFLAGTTNADVPHIALVNKAGD